MRPALPVVSNQRGVALVIAMLVLLVGGISLIAKSMRSHKG